MFGSISAGTVLLGLAAPAHAQTTMADWYGVEDYGYGGYSSGYQTYDGFGAGYIQAVVGGSVIMDRFGMLYRIPDVAPAPTSEGRRTEDGGRKKLNGSSDVVAAPALRAARARAGRARAGSGRVAAQPRYQLPTGSLYWPAANEVILYSPAMRYQSYGGGYGRDPYGSIDHGTMWKGWPLGY